MKKIETDRELRDSLCGTLNTPMRKEVECELNDRLWYELYGKLKENLHYELWDELSDELMIGLNGRWKI